MLHKCTSVRHALTAETARGGRRSVSTGSNAPDTQAKTTYLVCVDSRGNPEAVRPGVASGGFADARGLVAALALGADGTNMGTRFLCTEEAPVDRVVKEQIVANDERATQLIFRTLGNTARVADNEISRKVVEIENAGGTFEDIRELVAGLRGRRVFDDGDLSAGIWSSGQGQGLIHDIPTAGDLIARIMAEAEMIIAGRLASMLGAEPGVPR